ncbi:MAG TPA: hypothetical protein VGJ05_18455 [Fimbriiglobus sp.]
MYADMEQWTEIHRRVLVDGLSQREACKQYALHWRTLKKILTHAEPPGYRRLKPPRRPMIEPVSPIRPASCDMRSASRSRIASIHLCRLAERTVASNCLRDNL